MARKENVSESSKRSPRNKTLSLTEKEVAELEKRLLTREQLKASFGKQSSKSDSKETKGTSNANGSERGLSQRPLNGTFNGDYRELEQMLPAACVDLLILDPPYNLSKEFHGSKFNRQEVDEYTEWLDQIFASLRPLLKDSASVYICGDWYSSVSIFAAAARYFKIRNRITWEREKGRGARSNWKNSSEDIWFCTVSDIYTFNVDQVKLRRKVIAPYRDQERNPKDWDDTDNGAFRDTHPSNIWTDISIPFWSMPENTDHPTQKSEKLLAKLILASSQPGDLVLDPFLGSGTTSVVAKKLGRGYFGCEMEKYYCLLAEKRLMLAEKEPRVQGFADGVFWERNTMAEQQKPKLKSKSKSEPTAKSLPTSISKKKLI